LSFRAERRSRAAEESPGSAGLKGRGDPVRDFVVPANGIGDRHDNEPDRIASALRAWQSGRFLATASAHARLAGSE
jgi:hypothetical protein